MLKKSFISSILIATFSLGLVGCASVGNESMRNENSQSIDSKITKGTTTKEQIRSTVGNADKTSFTDSGNEIWTYVLSKATSKAINFVPIVGLFTGGADVEKKELVILFDQNSIVKNYTFSETKTEVKRGIGSTN